MRDEFALRRYRWALADAKREVAEDFRLLRLCRSALAISFVHFAENLRHEDRLALLLGQVKRAYPRAVERVGDVITPLEESLCDREAGSVQEGIAKGLGPFSSTERANRAKIPKRNFGNFSGSISLTEAWVSSIPGRCLQSGDTD